MSDNYWCPHIFRSGGHWAICIKGKTWCIQDDWIRCPVKDCGAVRPEEPKPLWRIVNDEYYFHDGCEDYAKTMSNFVLEWFKDMVPLITADQLTFINEEISKCKGGDSDNELENN